MKIVILGGGTAGWCCALFAKSVFPQSEITLVQNKEIGIIGVGEATTPHLITFLRNVGINPVDVIKETNGSIKNGICFENWNGDGKKYFHGFGENLSDFKVTNVFGTTSTDFFLKKLIYENKNIDEYRYLPALSFNNKVDVVNTSWAIHFDANKLADYMERVGCARGVKVTEGLYKNSILDEHGKITKICFEDSSELECDFVFDCSGFARLLVGGLYKEKWKSYSKYLPMKKAIPFWLESEDEIRPYTKAIAMKYGWMWNIPLQHRIGSGYIFDSDYINEEQALDEAEQYYGTKLKINKIIPFNTGRLENFWVKNCMSVGLASSFIEPLESTSLWVTVSQLDTFRQFLNEIKETDQKSIDLFNTIMSNTLDKTMHFIYLHYITKRNDSDFWKNFRKDYPVPKEFSNLLEKIKSGNIRYFDFKDSKASAVFELNNYLQVSAGIDIFEKQLNISAYELVNPTPDSYKELINMKIKQAISHRNFLNGL
jgi:tryptophan halogenase